MKSDLVLVTWYDAHSETGWFEPQEALDKHNPMTCWNVGWVVKKDKDGITLSPSVASDGGLGDVMFIPRGMIRQVTVIRKARKRVRP